MNDHAESIIRATIWIHRRLGANGYAEITELPSSELVTPMLAPELAVRLSDLGIAPATGPPNIFIHTIFSSRSIREFFFVSGVVA